MDGKELAEKGMKQSLLNADLDWRLVAEEVVRDFVYGSSTFTSDDVLLELEKKGVRSVNNSALGAIMRRFATLGKIEPFGYEPSKRPSRHRAPVRRWRSLEVKR